jgi:uncharacterized protein YdhG (YjbR/CyaY superfamily)
MKGIQASDIDEYIAQVPKEHRQVLGMLRDMIRKIAPDAVESISYGIPTYKLNGKPLVYFGTASTHYALYAISGVVREKYSEDLAGYSMSKGTIRFPLDKTIPKALIQKLIKAAVKENGVNAAVKKQKGPE